MFPALADNAFFVLGLAPECRAIEVETAGQKLLAMLAVGLAQAQTYMTPLGPQPRDAEKVRRAMAELRDPAKRLVHELWAQLPAQAVEVEVEADEASVTAFPQAFRLWHWPG